MRGDPGPTLVPDASSRRLLPGNHPGANQGSPRWCAASRWPRIEDMNQTQGPSTTDEQQSSPADAPGVDRQNLRNYEGLRRSTTDRKVAGVAGGLGRHLNIDPTILRVIFVVLCFFGGAGFVAYGAAWLLVPEDGQAEGKVSMSDSTRNGVLIAVGIVAALLVLGDSWNGIGFPWPLVIVGFGVLLYLAFRDRGSRSGTPAGSYGPAYPPVYGPMPDPAATSTGTTYAQQPPAPPWAPVTAQAAPAYQPRPPKRGPKLFGLTLALVAVALGALGLYDVAGGSVVASAYPALALTVVGVMLVVGAFVGRAGGLILLGLVSAVALAATTVVSGVGFGDGEQVDVAPTVASDVRSDYSVDTGRIQLDLSDVSDPAALDGRIVNVTAQAGEIVVILPEGIRSEVQAGIDGPGQIDLPGHGTGGISTDLDGTYGDRHRDRDHLHPSGRRPHRREEPLMNTPKTHPLNVGYLVVGLVFLGIAGSWALHTSGAVDTPDARWLVPAVLLFAGTVGLVAFAAKGISRGRQERRTVDPERRRRALGDVRRELDRLQRHRHRPDHPHRRRDR